MIALLVFVWIFGFLNIGLGIIWIQAWKKSINEPKKNSIHDATVSILVSVRNESRETLDRLNKSLLNLLDKNTEVIIIDDHSIPPLQKKDLPDDFILALNTGEGKKMARVQAAHLARGQYLVFTDADCTHHPQWIPALTAPLQHPQVGMSFGGVIPGNMKSFFALDDLAVSVATLASALAGFPVACSAASMACRKKDFTDWNPYTGNEKKLSGDDVFLMQACQAHGRVVKAVTHPNAGIYHPSARSVKDFFLQRMRWGQKTGSFSLKSLLLGILLLLKALILWICGLSLIINPLFAALMFMVWSGMVVVDYLFLFLVTRHWGLKLNGIRFFAAIVFHQVYLPVVAISGKLIPIRWKGRRINS